VQTPTDKCTQAKRGLSKEWSQEIMPQVCYKFKVILVRLKKETSSKNTLVTKVGLEMHKPCCKTCAQKLGEIPAD
jgi:hypothetical protein